MTEAEEEDLHALLGRKWEHNTVMVEFGSTGPTLVEKLDEAGRKGWECCAVTQAKKDDKHVWIAIIKRRIP